MIPWIPFSRLVNDVWTTSKRILCLVISYINTTFNGFWSDGLILWITSSKSISLGSWFKSSLIVLKTLVSLDSPPDAPILGYREIIESIKLLVSAIWEEISALICYPNASGGSTYGNSLILAS